MYDTATREAFKVKVEFLNYCQIENIYFYFYQGIYSKLQNKTTWEIVKVPKETWELWTPHKSSENVPKKSLESYLMKTVKPLRPKENQLTVR